MLKILAMMITVSLVGCSTIGASRIVEMSKNDLARCCQANYAQYELTAAKNKAGWVVSAVPRHAADPPGELIFRAGGDIQLHYDRNGNLKGVFRGQ